jgi:alkylation response protein AidB-like acyl-CoA dehydrogenase
MKSSTTNQLPVAGRRIAAGAKLVNWRFGMDSSIPVRMRDWVDRVRALAPIVEQWRDVAEQQRHMPQPLFEALRDAGVYKMSAPTVFGGDELDQVATVRVVEELSRLDGSVGWNVMIATGNGIAATCLPESAALEVFGSNPSTVIAGSLRPSPENRATPVDGGYCVTGRWAVASGCHQADWMAGACFVTGKHGLLTNADGGPELRLAVWPKADCEILDTWYTTGMRGTGSHDFQTTNAFVPDQRCLTVRASGPQKPGVLSLANAFARAAPLVAAVGLGISRTAIDSFKELASAKTPHAGTTTLAQQQTVQERVGQAEASLRAARAYLYQTISESSPLRTDEAIPEGVGAEIRLASAHAAQCAQQAVDLMFAAGGMSSVYSTSRLDRCFRDMHMVGQHIQVARSNIEMVGRYFLGLGLQLGR